MCAFVDSLNDREIALYLPRMRHVIKTKRHSRVYNNAKLKYLLQSLRTGRKWIHIWRNSSVVSTRITTAPYHVRLYLVC